MADSTSRWLESSVVIFSLSLLLLSPHAMVSLSCAEIILDYVQQVSPQ